MAGMIAALCGAVEGDDLYERVVVLTKPESASKLEALSHRIGMNASKILALLGSWAIANLIAGCEDRKRQQQCILILQHTKLEKKIGLSDGAKLLERIASMDDPAPLLTRIFFHEKMATEPTFEVYKPPNDVLIPFLLKILKKPSCLVLGLKMLRTIQRLAMAQHGTIGERMILVEM